MRLIDEIKKSPEQKEYWQSLLGEELLDHVIRHPDILEYTDIYGKELSDEERRAVIRNILQEAESGEELPFGQDVSFEPFFRYIANHVKEKLQVRMRDGADQGVICHVALQITESLAWLCMRCLIEEMHYLKQEKLLSGKDSTEEYQYFCDRYLGDASYVEELLGNYPVLTDLIASRTEAAAKYIHEIFLHLENDKQDIILQLCGGQAFDKIKDIWVNFSDEHFPGRTAAKIVLDNGCCIYHKPHGLSLAVYYDGVQQWIMEKCGMSDLQHRRLDFGNYGWETEVTYCSCHSRKEVESYYFRVGILVCVTYIMGISDLHYENIIPHGEHPVLIDVEFIADQRLARYVHPSDIREYLKDTVVNTGLLPTAIGENGDLNVGGLGEPGEQRASWRLPVIANAGTSDMAIAYDSPRVNAAKSLPEWNGEKADYRDYISFVIGGFTKAYEVMLHHKKEFVVLFGDGFDQKSRFLFRNTQEYFMYQNSMNFPSLMADGEQRRLMLADMDKGLRCNEKYRREILQYEMACIHNHIIPIFHSCGRDLYMGNGCCIANYFQSDGKGHILSRLERLSPKDLRLQRKVMEVIFLSVSKSNSGWTSDALSDSVRVCGLPPEKIADLLLDDMLVCGENFGWIGICYSMSGKLYPEILGLYLYDGLCGVAIFFAALYKKHACERYLQTYRRIAGALFGHTDKVISDPLNLTDCDWGLFSGETSLIYTYRILYKISGNEIFLDYAKKHSCLILKHLGDISGYDFVSGKAGVIVALVLMYEETGDPVYLEAAGELGDLLEKQAVPAGDGIGWANEGFSPLAGMAHGSCGIALAYAYLYRNTHDPHYTDIIKAAIRYEDTLYDAEKRNWMDIRGCKEDGEGKQDMVAWCHGAAGILSARLSVQRMTGIDMDTLFHMGLSPDEVRTQDDRKELLEKIADKILTSQSTDMCLCHGTAGLIEMLHYCENCMKKNLSAGSIADRLRESGVTSLSVEDRNNPGFMMGLSGIGYALLREQDASLPWILIPE